MTSIAPLYCGDGSLRQRIGRGLLWLAPSDEDAECGGHRRDVHGRGRHPHPRLSRDRPLDREYRRAHRRPALDRLDRRRSAADLLSAVFGIIAGAVVFAVVMAAHRLWPRQEGEAV